MGNAPPSVAEIADRGGVGGDRAEHAERPGFFRPGSTRRTTSSSASAASASIIQLAFLPRPISQLRARVQASLRIAQPQAFRHRGERGVPTPGTRGGGVSTAASSRPLPRGARAGLMSRRSPGGRAGPKRGACGPRSPRRPPPRRSVLGGTASAMKTRQLISPSSASVRASPRAPRDGQIPAMAACGAPRASRPPGTPGRSRAPRPRYDQRQARGGQAEDPGRRVLRSGPAPPERGHRGPQPKGTRAHPHQMASMPGQRERDASGRGSCTHWPTMPSGWGRPPTRQLLLGVISGCAAGSAHLIVGLGNGQARRAGAEGHHDGCAFFCSRTWHGGARRTWGCTLGFACALGFSMPWASCALGCSLFALSGRLRRGGNDARGARELSAALLASPRGASTSSAYSGGAEEVEHEGPSGPASPQASAAAARGSSGARWLG
jgi:hypothetical protein